MKQGPAENMTIAVLKQLGSKDKGIAFCSKDKKSELVQIFSTQAGYVTACDQCFPKLKLSSFTLLTNTHKTKSIATWSILVSILVSFIFRLVGYCSVVLLLTKELGKVKYCTIENHLHFASRHRQQELQIHRKMHR